MFPLFKFLQILQNDKNKFNLNKSYNLLLFYINFYIFIYRKQVLIFYLSYKFNLQF
ncbi:hypothetical protein pb186bvf_005850 [Paramecium bursaria]